MNRKFFQRGGWWVLGQNSLLLAVFILGIGFGKAPQFGLTLIFATVFFLAFAICAIAGLKTLGRNLTVFPKPRAQAELVQHGIYKVIRHPLYTALICLAAGWSLLWQSHPALVATVILAIYLDAKARREERWLQEQFSDYEHYAKHVRRFIPWVY